MSTKVRLAALLAALTLVACGGGGGGSTPVPPPPAATGTFAGTATCVIPSGQAICAPVITWRLDNEVAPSTVTLDGTVVATTGDGELRNLSVGHGSHTLVLSDKSGALATMAFVIDCGGGLTWNGNQCVTPVLHYSEKVYAIWGIFVKPYLLNKDGTKTVVENASSYTTGGGGINPLAGCAKGIKLADGRRLLRCQNTANGTQVDLYLDPSTNKMHDFTEALPPGATWTYVQTDGAHYPTWARETMASDGTYFVESPVIWKVMFQDLAGRVSVAVDGTFATDGDVAVLWTEPAQ